MRDPERLVNISINDKQLQIMLTRMVERLNPAPLLNIAAQVMRSSFERTFRDQGSPGGSWAPLAPATIKRGRGGAGRKILIQRGRLKNTLTYETNGNRLTMGSNLVYARIQQEGGEAGRRSPFKKQQGRRPRIPARPYLVFRPEDPQKIAGEIERFINSPAAGGGQ